MAEKGGGPQKPQSVVLKLDDVGRSTPGVGNKAAMLGELLQAGFETPPGFVVKTDAWDKFLRMNRLEPKIRDMADSVDMKDSSALADMTNRAQSLIMQAQLPEALMNEIREEYEELSVGREVKEIGGAALDLIRAGRSQAFVSVRASPIDDGPKARAFFNVKGPAFPDAVRGCWASLFAPHAIFYRKSRQMDALPKAALIVQKMVEPEKSGTIFTSWPAAPDKNRVLVEASWGLGDMIALGAVVPDEYVLDSERGHVISKSVNKKLYMRRTNELSGRAEKENVPREKIGRNVLDESELKKLWELARKVEEHYSGQPQLIKWCQQRGRVFVMGVKRILPAKQLAHVPEEPQGELMGESPMLSGNPASPGAAKGTARIVLDPNVPYEISKSDVIVTKMPGPELIPMMVGAGAIVSDSGGKSSYISVISRELGIPCITGAESATAVLKDGQEVFVDALKGRVYANREPAVKDCGSGAYGHSRDETIQPKAERALGTSIPHVHEGPDNFVATDVKVTLSFPEPVNTESSDGVGLLKAEHMLAESGIHPAHMAQTAPEHLIQMLVEGIGKVARAYYPKQVWYRLMNARTDEFRGLEGGHEESESNPILGWRGIRRSLEQPVVFRCEVEAVKRLYQQGLNNVAIMLPFVSKLGELRKARDTISSAFSTNGTNLPPLPLMGIIVETPAAALEIEAFCREGLNFASIDIDSLAQLTLAADGQNPKTSGICSENDPAVVSLIRHVIGVCRRYNVRTSVFGEATNNPEVIDMLVGLGTGSISAEADTFRQIRDIVARSEKKLLLDRARDTQNI